MRSDRTYIWGVAADEAGIIQHTHYGSKPLPKSALRPRGGLRAWKEVELVHEPASAYASSHPAPMLMRWGHNEEIGKIVALRRNHGRLLAYGETVLEPDELAGLTEKYGELRWSTSTDNRRNEKLRIDEISLTPHPATIALPPVRWYKLNVTGGNLPMGVKEALDRADKLEFRQRRELQVHDLDYERKPYSDPDRFEREVGLLRGGSLGYMTIEGERVPIESHSGGRILKVEGRPVRRSNG